MRTSLIKKHISREVLAQRARELLGYKDSVYKSLYDDPGAIFIHIPKCAGTSISHALYGKPTWHWKVTDLRFINRKKYETYYSFSVVRNPWARLYSTYKYAPIDAQKYSGSPLAIILDYSTFEEFVMRYLTKDVVCSHQFLATQRSYLSVGNRLAVDAIGNFEKLEQFIDQLSQTLPQFTSGIPHMNISADNKSLRDVYTTSMIDKVADLYAEDVEVFGYDFPESA